MGNKSPALVKAESTIEVLTSTLDEKLNSINQKDMIIDDIYRSEKEVKEQLAEAKLRITTLEAEVMKVKLDEVMAGMALAKKDAQLQRALGWIDNARGFEPGDTKLLETVVGEQEAFDAN
jgi:hypothetical protein